MFCTACGGRLPAGAFCPACGAPVGSAPADQRFAPPPAGPPLAPQERRVRPPWALTGLVAFVAVTALALAGIAVWVVLRPALATAPVVAVTPPSPPESVTAASSPTATPRSTSTPTPDPAAAAARAAALRGDDPAHSRMVSWGFAVHFAAVWFLVVRALVRPEPVPTRLAYARYEDVASNLVVDAVWRLLTGRLFHACMAGITAFFLGLARHRTRQAVPLVVFGLLAASVPRTATDEA